MNRTVNKPGSQSLLLVDSEVTVKEVVLRILDSASIRNFEISKHGQRYRIIIPTKYHVPQICLKQLESNGYPVHLLHGDEQGLEIEIGENKK